MSSTSYDSIPFLHANVLSRFFHYWLTPLLTKSRKQGVLHLQDLYDLPPFLKSTELTDKLETNWFNEVKQHPQNPSLIRATLHTLGWKPFLMGFLAMLHGIAQIIQPLLLTFLMNFFESCSSMPAWHAWLLVLAMILTTFISSLVHNRYFYQNNIYANQMMIAYTGLIYRKVLRLSSHSMNRITSGEIVNILANDATRIEMVMYFFNYLWIGPLQVILVIYLFWYFVKYIALIAIGYSVLLLLIQPLYSRFFVHIRIKTLQITDQRIKIMTEIIKSMRIVKMYCWESAFIRKISLIRKQEMSQFIFYAIGDSFQSLLANSYTNVTFLLIYTALWSLNIRLDTRFFAVASCIMGFMAVHVIEFFSMAIRDLSDYLVARTRIEKFLLLDECQRDNRLLSSSASSTELSSSDKGIEVICHIKQAQWDQKGTTFTLRNIMFDAHPGDLICIIGPVGSGKSSLLQTLTGEIGYFDGKVRLDGSFCYVPQEAWIFSSTIKNNILFGQEYNHKLFQDVIRATVLEKDFEQLPDAANTLVGDQGVMLSGGQKARVNLARALYRNADIYLLDDPLSAVDVKVSKELFERAIKRYLKNKICILVTHQIQFLRDATKIVVLYNGEMIQTGTYTDLVSSSSSFAHLLKDIHQHEQDIIKNMQRQQSIISMVHSEDDNEEELIRDIDTKQEGSIKWKIYISYIKAGFCRTAGLLVLVSIFTAHQATALYSNWWLATWSDDESDRYRDLTHCSSNISKNVNKLHLMTEQQWHTYRNNRFYVYCGIVILSLVFNYLRIFIGELMCLNAGRVLHNRMFQRVIRCPISFFDKNPIGRILNRFTKDIAIMDSDLTMNIPDFFHCISTVLGIVILVGLLNPWSFVPAIVGVIGMLIVRYRYARCFRDLKRLEGITRSPIYSYLSSTIHGLKVIRSHYAEHRCSREFQSYLDDYTRAHFLVFTTERWSAMRFDWVTLTFLALVTVFSMLVRIYSQQFTTADVALTLSYSLNLMGLFQWTIRQSVTVESQMTAVERVLEYCALDQEPPAQVHPQHRPPPTWPSKGQITLTNVSMSYSNDDHTTLALRNITLSIQGGEKIGIVGRTGAGKSSLIQILFRMGTIVHGHILIDNIDISTVGLDDLRGRISIIPQDPVLFTGTIRTNLDPFDLYSDQQIWNALEQVQLKGFISGLDILVSENGSNLSVGQKQLICLARAILKKSQILVIDEATANVDNATDELIQEAIRNKFEECTVLTVAHRLRTVIDSDKILVLDAGEVVEFDAPTVLLGNEHSYFVSLVDETGVAESAHLRTLANRSSQKMKTKKEETIVDNHQPETSMNENDPLLV